jgi:hypothetical protein
MFNSLLEIVFGCGHRHTTFPLTPSRNSRRPERARGGTYIVCLDCGKEFDYNWKEMRVGPGVQAAAAVVHDQSMIEAMPMGAEQPTVH